MAPSPGLPAYWFKSVKGAGCYYVIRPSGQHGYGYATLIETDPRRLKG